MNQVRIITGPPALGRSEERQKKLNWELVYAVGAGEWKKASELLDSGADPNSRNAWGHPILITIASSAPRWLLDKAIEKGGDGDIKAPVNDWTPKKAAQVSGNREALRAFERAKETPPTGF